MSLAEWLSSEKFPFHLSKFNWVHHLSSFLMRNGIGFCDPVINKVVNSADKTGCRVRTFLVKRPKYHLITYVSLKSRI